MTELSTILGDQIAEIEAEMRTDIKAYHRNPEKRARHLSLIEQQEAARSPPRSTDPTASWYQRAEIPAVERARGHAASILGAFAGEPDKGRDFKASFEGLPRAVQEACFTELSGSAPGYVKAASADELDGVRAGLAGDKELIAAWGGQASKKLGRALDAIERVEKSVSPDDRRQFKGWFSRIPHRERVLLLWGAAG
jgi:hypothetical protein